jgi:hypothetical protein
MEDSVVKFAAERSTLRSSKILKKVTKGLEHESITHQGRLQIRPRRRR